MPLTRRFYYLAVVLLTVGLLVVFLTVSSAGEHRLESRIRQTLDHSPAQLPKVLQSASSVDLRSLIESKDDQVAAAAVLALADRRDTGSTNAIKQRFRTLMPPTSAMSHDPHQPATPELQLFTACSTYLARTDPQFLPELLSRREVWLFPERFVSTMASFGSGWVEELARAARSDPDRGSAGYLIATAAGPENEAELVQLMRDDKGGVIWNGALQACERLRSVACNLALTKNLRALRPDQRLAAAIVGFRSGSTTEPDFVHSIEEAAAQTVTANSSEEYMALLEQLYMGIVLCQNKQCVLPERLKLTLEGLQSPTITRKLLEFTGTP